MTDYERVLLAMKMVNKHKLNSIVRIEELQLLAETAVKTMYLIDAENEKKNSAFFGQLANEAEADERF